MPRTFKLTIAYDGTDFAGWQRQASDRTVQAAIEDALLPIEGTRAILIGAGWTDAGVHAASQVASVSLTSAIPVDELGRALNATLPEDIRILAIELATEGFNAQFAAKRKTYRYWIWTTGVVPPQLRRYVWHVPQPLDLDVMNAAAGIVIGEHDFAAFQASGSDVVTTTREVIVSRLIEPPSASGGDDAVGPFAVTPAAPGRLAGYEVTGTGFLRHMVRNIVGTLVDIGRGRRPVDDMTIVLASRNRATASATAPAQGLVLWRVDY